ncbi:MAG TPA: proteasome-activating nucleotidase [Candidatus Thermoplasmatota archaeon]|jgi:proteasome regulatory subunit|nr:proteasome-activating nucleotidase [Candidatus Thermoplasmatota archaeon]
MEDEVELPLPEIVPAGEDYSKFLEERIRQLEVRASQLRDQKRRLENTARVAEVDKQRLLRELRQLRAELEKLRTPPLLVGFVKDVLADGRIVLKSSTGPHFVVHCADELDKATVLPGARVSLNQQTLAVVGVLPPSTDPLVYGAEVITRPDVGYDDVGGMKAAVREIREAVELPLTQPELFQRIGIDPPKGVLLFGLPGTGKTLLAKAVAHHTNATFIRLAGSELVQKYIGEGARLVRELFQLARDKAPSIVFIDELDAIGSARYEASTSGDREVQRTLMQLLSEMDGFSARGDVRIIAATNRPDMLDQALLRPGRFDRLIEVPLPDTQGRVEILKIHSRRMALAADVDLQFVALEAGNTATGADLKAICTEAGMFAIREQRPDVAIEHFRRGVDKVLGSSIKDAQKVVKDAAFA